MNARSLVIGYGNELRGDDGLGPRVARRVAERHWNGVEAIAVHQLTPELAERIAAIEQVVFVDAALGQSVAVMVQSVDCSSAAPIFSIPAGDRSRGEQGSKTNANQTTGRSWSTERDRSTPCGSSSLTHYADPHSLLDLSVAVFGRRPRAWLVTLRGTRMEFGEELSSDAERRVDPAVDRIRALVQGRMLCCEAAAHA